MALAALALVAWHLEFEFSKRDRIESNVQSDVYLHHGYGLLKAGGKTELPTAAAVLVTSFD